MSSNPFDLSSMIGPLMVSAPFLVVAFAGVVICLVRDSRPNRVRVAVGCALALHLLNHLGLGVVSSFIIQQATRSGNNVGMPLFVVQMVGSLVYAVALGLLLYAAFTKDDQTIAAHGE